jgi:nitrate reductase gamma subunit
MGHNILLQERWGFRFITLPEKIADIMTLAVMVSALLILLRRIALPEVRILTNANDLLLLAITVAPFITGFLARMQVYDYNFWLIAHILSGEALLIAIPFTRLSHMVLFFMSRAQIGMDYGIKRGGMKGRGIVW